MDEVRRDLVACDEAEAGLRARGPLSTSWDSGADEWAYHVFRLRTRG